MRAAQPGLLSAFLAASAAVVCGQASPAPTTALPDASASPALAVPNASASPTIAPVDLLGGLVKDGHLKVEADLHAGSVPAIPKYALVVEGSPKMTVEADAADGAVTKMKFLVENGKLIVRGSGLRPRVSIEELDFQAPQGVTAMKFHGLGIWKPIVAIFGGIARSAVKKMEFRTDIPSVLKGEILGGRRRLRPRRPRRLPLPRPAPR